MLLALRQAKEDLEGAWMLAWTTPVASDFSGSAVLAGNGNFATLQSL